MVTSIIEKQKKDLSKEEPKDYVCPSCKQPINVSKSEIFATDMTMILYCQNKDCHVIRFKILNTW